jgi:predicted NBD/HSP70 family sugar kinase
VENGLQCRCGSFGCLETVVSDLAVVRRAQALAGPGSLLHALADPDEGLTLEIVGRAFQAGDPSARQAVLEVGRYLGIAAATLVGTFNIRRIVLASGLARLGAPLSEVIRQEMLRRSLPALAQETHIELVELSPDAVILGASALLLTHELGLSLSR